MASIFVPTSVSTLIYEGVRNPKYTFGILA